MNNILKYTLYIISLVSLLVLGWLFGKSDFIKNRNLTTLTVEKNVYDFGGIPKDIETLVYFKYKNSGNAPLILNDVETRCGCTAAKWDREPLMPGKIDSLAVYYDAKTPGVFSKEILIHYNSKNSFAQLIVTGTVIKDTLSD